jgi:23S rRNA (cytidine1920-2'-O)/16S rRNA (cytidine1409-2'-O)-methyltransferase
MEAKGQRVDTLMVERGLAESRSRAQGLILAGAVRVGE